MIDAREVVLREGYIRYPARGSYVCQHIKLRIVHYHGNNLTWFLN
jgi:hypothetical protein